MALTDTQIAQRLLKKGLGVAETNYPLSTRGVLEEAIPTYSVVTPESIWVESSGIPSTPPVLPNEGESGVVKYYEKLQLVITDAGTVVAFKSPLGELENAISGQFGFGYNFKVYGGVGGSTQIFKGDWLVDAEAGVLIFYNPGLAETTVDATHVPYITFYKYIGATGFTTIVSDLSTAISSEESLRNSADESLANVISGSLSTEISNRESADLSLSTALSNIIYDSNYGDTIGVAYTVGGVVSGTLIGTLTGKTFSQLFDDIFVPTILASIGTPNSATLGGVGSTTVEVGTAYSPSTTATYIPGLITNGNGSSGPNLTGDGNNYVFKLPNSTTDGTYATAGNSQGHTFSSYNVAFGSNTWTVVISYSSAVGVGTYYDNKGNPGSNLDGSRGSGSLTPNSGTVVARRRWWWGTGTAGSAPTNSAGVRALTSTGLLSASDTGTFDISIPPSTRGVWFFIPTGKSVLVQFVESAFAVIPIDSGPGSFITSAITVNDAGGTGQSYKSYVCDIGGSGYPGTSTYRVTIS